MLAGKHHRLWTAGIASAADTDLADEHLIVQAINLVASTSRSHHKKPDAHFGRAGARTTTAIGRSNRSAIRKGLLVVPGTGIGQRRRAVTLTRSTPGGAVRDGSSRTANRRGLHP